MKPRTRSPPPASGFAARAAIWRTASANTSGVPMSSVMSLKRTPFLGSRARRGCSGQVLHWRFSSPGVSAYARPESAKLDRCPELLQRARLDLAHAFTRDPEVIAGLLQRPRTPSWKP